MLPVGLVAFLFGSRFLLLGLTTFFAAFSATAVINFTSAGLQPSYYFGVLFIARVMLDSMLTRRSFTSRQWQLFVGFVFFAVIAFMSILAIPLEGRPMVMRPSSSGDLEMLRLTSENITQYMYLLFALMLTGAIGLSRMGEKEIGRLLKIFLASGVFVSLWGWFQVVSFYSNIPYPDFLFNNSVSMKELFGQLVEHAFKRMTSVAAEPSMLAKFLVIPTFITLYSVYNKKFLIPYKHALPLASFFVVTMVFTTSSSALAGLIGGFFIFFFVIFYRKRMVARLGMKEKTNLKGLFIFASVFVGLATAVLIVAFIKLHLTFSDLGNLIDVLLFSKLETQSGVSRLEAGKFALNLFLSHPVLGVGWGSNRSFDFLSNTGAATGIIGLTILLVAHFVLACRMTRLSKQLVRSRRLRLSHYPLLLTFILVIKFFLKILAEPGILFLDYWILIGIMISCVRGLALPREETPQGLDVFQQKEELA
jgi:hypothetical protein